jgi:hypothetical protein
MALHAKAKAEAGYRFYAPYDKISRDDDILAYAWAQCGEFCLRTWDRPGGRRTLQCMRWDIPASAANLAGTSVDSAGGGSRRMKEGPR